MPIDLLKLPTQPVQSQPDSNVDSGIDLSLMPKQPELDLPKNQFGKNIPVFRTVRPDDVFTPLTPEENRKALDKDLWGRLPVHQKSEVVMDSIARKLEPAAGLGFTPFGFVIAGVKEAINIGVPLINGEGIKEYDLSKQHELIDLEIVQNRLDEIPETAEGLPDPPSAFKALPGLWVYYKAAQWSSKNPRASAELGFRTGEAALELFLAHKIANSGQFFSSLLKENASVGRAYKTLNVTRFAKTADITKQYRAMALKAHPDWGGSAELFNEVQKAYQTIRADRASLGNKVLDIFRSKKAKPKTAIEFMKSLGGKESITSSEAAQAMNIEGAESIVEVAAKSGSLELFKKTVTENPKLTALIPSVAKSEQELELLYHTTKYMNTLPAEDIALKATLDTAFKIPAKIAKEGAKSLTEAQAKSILGIDATGKPTKGGLVSVSSTVGKSIPLKTIGQGGKQTGLEGINPVTLGEIIELANTNKIEITITGGTEAGHLDAGEITHGAGTKVDLRKEAKLDAIIQAWEQVAARPSDGAIGFKNPKTGSVFWDEGNHWDVETNPSKIMTDIKKVKVVEPKAVLGVSTGAKISEPEVLQDSPAFRKHSEFLQGIQLPAESNIRKIQKQMRVVNGKRLSGKITAKEANKEIASLKKQLRATAKKEGIAIRATKSGKVSVALRKAGTFVPIEFSEWKSFKDVKQFFGGGTDITRLIQQMDGSLTAAQRAKIPGQAGPLEKFVLFRTRDISIQKIGYIKEKSILLRSIIGKVKPGSKTDIAINDVLRAISNEDLKSTATVLAKRSAISNITKDISIVKKAMELRKFYNTILDEQNEVRLMRNQKPIPFRSNYSPEVLRDTTVWERLFLKDTVPQEVQSAPDLPDYVRPNKPFNPRELARTTGIRYNDRVLSAIELAQNYIVTASKDIFNTSIIQNNKAFIQQLETMGFNDTANALADWNAEAFAGTKISFDKNFKLPAKLEKGIRFLNRLRNLAVFPFNFSWNIFTQTSSVSLTVLKYGAINTTKGFIKWLDPKVRKQTSEDYYSFIVKSDKQGRVTKQDAQALIGQNVRIYRSPLDIAEDVGALVTEQIEKILTGASIQAAKISGQQAGLTGEALKNFASDGGGKTQSMYNDEDKPRILKSLLTKTIAPFQTFAFEFINTAREIAGKTGLPPDSKAKALWQIIRFAAVASVFATSAKRLANREIWSWRRPPVPFAEIWLTPIIDKLLGEYQGSAGLPAPVQVFTKLAQGINDIIETGSWERMRKELTKWGPGVFGVPGGVQISRVVEAMIAYARGGVINRQGEFIFLLDESDLPQALLNGIWSTEAGKATIEAKKGGKPQVIKLGN